MLLFLHTFCKPSIVLKKRWVCHKKPVYSNFRLAFVFDTCTCGLVQQPQSDLLNQLCILKWWKLQHSKGFKIPSVIPFPHILIEFVSFFVSIVHGVQARLIWAFYYFWASQSRIPSSPAGPRSGSGCSPSALSSPMWWTPSGRRSCLARPFSPPRRTRKQKLTAFATAWTPTSSGTLATVHPGTNQHNTL